MQHGEYDGGDWYAHRAEDEAERGIEAPKIILAGRSAKGGVDGQGE